MTLIIDRNNCETFCNMVVFNIPYAVQADNTRTIMRGEILVSCPTRFSWSC